jgi:hypothetical protein
MPVDCKATVALRQSQDLPALSLGGDHVLVCDRLLLYHVLKKKKNSRKACSEAPHGEGGASGAPMDC